MKKFLRIFFLIIVFCSLSVGGFAISYESASAGIVPCGNTIDDMCTLCHLLEGINNIIQWGLKAMGIIAVIMIVVAGIFYIVSMGNENMMGTAKELLKSVLIGVVVMLLAWVIVNTIINVLGVNYKTGLWYAPEFVCENPNSGAVSETGASNTNNPGSGGNPTVP